MADWTCHSCRGLGMYWVDDQRTIQPDGTYKIVCGHMELCDCTAGEEKRVYLEKGEEVLRREARDRGRRKRKKEKVPF